MATEQTPSHRAWKGTTGGTRWMQQTLVFCLGWMNLPFVYTGMALVIPFYMLFNHQGYITQYHFFRKRLGYGPLKAFVHVYLNHFVFGQIILDRFAVYGGQKFKVDIEGNEIFLDHIARPEGFLQLSSHVGNFELSGYMLKQDKKPINALVFGGETGTVMANRIRVFREMNIKLISVGNDLGHVLAMNQALADGEIISMTGDRNFGSQKSVKCRFFGAEAEFPLGPYVLAAQRDVPVLSIFVMKESVYRYRIFVRKVEVPPSDKPLPLRAKGAALAQAFANQLEETVRRYPHQWYNYYEFWND